MEHLTLPILFAKACVWLMKKSNMTCIILRISIIKGFFLLLLYLNARLTGTITYPLIFSVN
jgi:multisubunit Na+/H+ antiporter MnhC subunit